MGNNSSTGRNATIDIARGIAIILVFLGHIRLTPGLGSLWLQSFHMPLFFVCSGLVFSTRKYPRFGKFFVAQVRSLAIPYFTLGITLYFLMCLIDVINSYLNGVPVTLSWHIKDVLISLFLGYRQHERYFSLWFLTTLFGGRIAFYFITKLFKERTYYYLALSVGLTIVQWLVFKYTFGFYWSADLIPACLAFLSFGYFLKTAPRRINQLLYSHKLIPIITLLSLALAILNYRVEGKSAGLYSCYMGNLVWYYLGAVVGCWMVLAFSHYLGNHRLLEFFGKNTLVLYAYQNSFSIVISNIIIRMLAEHYELLNDVTTQWLFVVVCSITIGSILAIIVKKYCPWLLGQKKAV